MKNFQKLLMAMAVGYFHKSFVCDVWLSSKCVWNLSYLSTIHLLLYLFKDVPKISSKIRKSKILENVEKYHTCKTATFFEKELSLKIYILHTLIKPSWKN